jgi:hypothetical protein
MGAITLITTPLFLNSRAYKVQAHLKLLKYKN